MANSLFKLVKNLFFIFLLIQFVPAIIIGTKRIVDDMLHPKQHIALLPVNGFIGDAAFYTSRVHTFLKDESVKGLVLRINSPGGYSGCCQAIFNELKHFAQKKPVVALIENVGASGSYYMAAAANVIIASPMSMIGSIGVYMELASIQKLLDTWHIKHQFIQSGKYKTASSMAKDLSADENAYLQRISDEQYQCFVREVAAARKLDAAQHTAWADGQVFTGAQAQHLRLIDELGSITEATAAIKKLAHLDPAEEVKFIQAPRNAGLLRQLFAGDEDGETEDGVVGAATSALASFAAALHKQFAAACATQQVPQTT